MRPLEWVETSPARAAACVFLLSFALRAAALSSWMIPERYVFPETTSEIGAVAQSLALRGEYADPYIVPTGPTAHPPPFFTILLGLIYRLFGLTLAAGYVRSLIGIACYSAMHAMIPWFAAKVGLGVRAGLIGGMAGALLFQQGTAEVIGWTATEPLAGIALGALLAASVRRWSGAPGSAKGALLLGLGWGLSFHLVPALLMVMLGCVGFELWWSRDRRKWALAAVLVLGAALASVPWTLRNYAAFHEIVFLRSNLGLELRLANHEGAVADIERLDAIEGRAMRHPRINRGEAAQVRELGELEYMRRAKREALDWIGAHPGAFCRLTALRAIQFWCGPLQRPLMAAWITALSVLALVGLLRTLPMLAVPARAAILLPLATFPLVYYVVISMSRYAVPVNWILLMLAGAAIAGRSDSHSDGK